MDGISLAPTDVVHHIASIGLDIYPPIDMKKERTRLTIFFEDVRERWPELYEELIVGESEFRISASFREKSQVEGSAIRAETFVLTQRGPVFIFPLRLADPVGLTDLEGRFSDLFSEVSRVLWSRLPGHTILRAGVVRDVILSTGESDCKNIASSRSEWCGAKLVGGHRLIQYRDEKYNIRLEFGPIRLGTTTVLPAGMQVSQQAGHGLRLRLDVNLANAEVRRLQDADIEEVIQRSAGFWPDELLRYIRGTA